MVTDEAGIMYRPDLLRWMDEYPLAAGDRPTWEHYFLLLAFIASRRSSCLRKKVGAVLVKDKNVISSGYNGAPAPQVSCMELGECYRDKHNILSGPQLERCRASGSHAESNAIALAAKNGHLTAGSVLYLYGHAYICNMCRGIIANAGISQVIHLRDDGRVNTYTIAEDWATNILDREGAGSGKK